MVKYQKISPQNAWFVATTFFLLCLSLPLFRYLGSSFNGNSLTAAISFSILGSHNSTPSTPKRRFEANSCKGRYIYIHDLPPRFNSDLLSDCQVLSNWFDFCPYVRNNGFGPQLEDSGGVLSDNTSWFATNQFMLSVLFHNRMKQYECLTRNSTLASAIYVPFYAGLEIGRHLWGRISAVVRDAAAIELVGWLREKPEWKRMMGRDHFFVSGRITWDFRRLSNVKLDWGSILLYLPEAKNMTMLTIESSPYGKNDFAIPYPTYFHPSKEIQVFEWQERLRKEKRQYLFAFGGARRPNMTKSIRGQLINQCLNTSQNCKLVTCVPGEFNCDSPVHLMKWFKRSIFCLQPPGDSFTRRSTFDSILAGCIPVFFHPGSAYIQYVWHLLASRHYLFSQHPYSTRTILAALLLYGVDSMRFLILEADASDRPMYLILTSSICLLSSPVLLRREPLWHWMVVVVAATNHEHVSTSTTTRKSKLGLIN